MKRLGLFIVSILLIIPFSVLAADPKVLTVTADDSGSSIEYSGTTEDGVSAVMCKLYNSNNKELDKLSSSVANNSFEGSFSDVSNGTYTVACARYEGGEVVSDEVTLENSTVTSNDDDTSATTTGSNSKTTTSNPKTYDAGIMNSVILFAICLAGAIGSIIYLKKKKVNE